MLKNNKNSVFQKHLKNIDREDIERLLKAGFKFYQIAERLRKDPTTISKEVKRNRTMHNPSGFNNSSNHCKHKRNCTIKNLCASNCHSLCSKCSKCNNVCSHFELAVCERLLHPPYVCNPCSNYTQCRKVKFIYFASEAQKKYKDILVSSRQGINMTEEELTKTDNLVSPLIKKGQSVKTIVKNNKNKLSCGASSLYNYIDMGLLSIKNIDLPRRVRYKPRGKNPKLKKDYKYRIGRTYEDFKNFLEENPNINVVEMDTVEGVKGEKVLLTLIFRNFNFMIARIIPDKTSKSVIDEFNNLEKIFTPELFKRFFKCILTDNGGEFQNPEELEKSIDGSKRTSIFYCNPNRSDQKGKVEKNHVYIRYIIPKGTSMNKYTQEDIDLMMSHINSTAREIFNFATPIDMATPYLGTETLKKLNVFKVSPNNIILKPSLINNKNRPNN